MRVTAKRLIHAALMMGHGLGFCVKTEGIKVSVWL
jgi:hypothetical protein